MDTSSTFVSCFALGVIAGLRSLTAPAAVSWGAYLQWLDLDGTWAAFMSSEAARDLLTAFALLELVGDKLPKTPSRKAPGPFAARVILGAFSGAVLGASARRSPAAGLLFGVLGAAAGTLGGYEARTRSVKALNVPDAVVAVLEDSVAIGGGLLTVSRRA